MNNQWIEALARLPRDQLMTIYEIMLDVHTKQQANALPHAKHGVCVNAQEVAKDDRYKAVVEKMCGDMWWVLDGVIKGCAQHWEHWSGDYRYPVPYKPDNGLKLDAELCYVAATNNHTMWTGEYGALRKQLLTLTIAYLHQAIVLQSERESNQ